MATTRKHAFLLAALLALPLVPAPLLAGTAGAASAPALEALRNGSFEGVPGAANGYELSGGAESAAIAEHGAQSVNLARTGASPDAANVLGNVSLLLTHPVELRHVTNLAYSYNVPRDPPFSRLRVAVTLDLDGDGIADACLVAQPADALAATGGWVRRTIDGAGSFAVGDGTCPAGGPRQTLADLQADPAYRVAKVLRVNLLVSTSIGPWPIAPVYVDRASLLATSSPLIRIRDAADNLCDGASFATVAAALACAGTNATILLTPGTHVGTVTLAQPVTLCATSAAGTDCEAGRTDVVLRGDTPYAILITSDDVTVRGLVIENPLYAGSDQTVGSRIDPTLVATTGNRVRIVENELRAAAAAPGLGQSRWSTFGIHVQAGSAVEVRDNRIHQFPSSLGSDGVCANEPCATIGIRVAAGAADATIAKNAIELDGTRRAQGVVAAGEGALVDRNTLRIPGGTRSTGILVTNLTGGQIMQNSVVAADSGRPAYGLRGLNVDASIAQNNFTGMTEAVSLTAAPGARLDLFANVVTDPITAFRLEGNATLLNNRIVRADDAFLFAGTATLNVTLRENVLRSARTLLRTESTVANATFDARENDWGVYTQPAVNRLILDGGAGNAIDATCYIDVDRVTRICPPTPVFTWTPDTPSWGKPVNFTHASVSGGRPVSSVAWTFGDGASATAVNPLHAYAAPGTYDVTLKVTDQDGTEVALTRALTVVNHAPVLAPLGPYVVQENQTMTFALQAADPDGDALTYSMVAGPADALFHAPDATFSWKPNFTQSGIHTLTFKANDSFAENVLEVQVNVTEVNAPPFLEPVGNQIVDEGQTLRFTVRATDVDGQRIRLQAFIRPIGSTFVDHGNGTGTFTWTPAHHQSGVYPLTIEANDALLEVRERITITVVDVNRPPIFDSLPNFTVAETSLLQFLVSASDIDNDEIVFAAPVLPAGAVFNTTSLRFAWTPNYEQEGVHRVVFTANDSKGISQAETFIHVTKTNRAPTIDPMPVRGVAYNRSVVFAVTATDPDRDPVTIRMPDVPPGATFDPATRIFSWRPAESDVGRQELLFVADDGTATGSGIAILNVIVNHAPQATIELPPRIDTYVKAVFRATAVDPDSNGVVNLQWDFDSRDGLAYDRAGGYIEWTYTHPGTYNVTVRATDRDGITNFTVLEVTVDDSLLMTLQVMDATPDILTATHVRVTLKLSDGTPVAGTIVNVTVAYQPHVGVPRQPESTMRVATDSAGVADVFLRRDVPPLNLPGRHVVTADAFILDSMNGDTESAAARQEYSVGLP